MKVLERLNEAPINCKVIGETQTLSYLSLMEYRALNKSFNSDLDIELGDIGKAAVEFQDLVDKIKKKIIEQRARLYVFITVKNDSMIEYLQVEILRPWNAGLRMRKPLTLESAQR
ncbi:hypothetical protein E5288_WYG022432 [Bos mutus]|uniref:Uncharacterized protein n=1 Tax=Bos mutus TaxID=72004 RepID=A0A6B0RWF0_9CETA|nr:hypothetical protein [Bos mutus]